MRKSLKQIAQLTAISASLSFGSCYAPVGGKPKVVTAIAPLSEFKPGPRHVAVDSKLAYSADEDVPPPAMVLESARGAVASGTGLDKLVQRWPDAVAALLRDSIISETDVPLRLAIADAYDNAFHSADPAHGWSTALAKTQSQHEAYRKFTQNRDQIFTLFHTGRFADAVKIKITDSLPADAPAVLQTEAQRIAGLALVLDNKPDKAAELFEKAVATAASGPHHEQFEIGLLLTEARSRHGDTASASTAWQSTIALAANVRDPELWERAILTKPATINWPAEASISGANEPDFTPGLPPDTGDVLIAIGKMRLSRGAPQPALLSFSRAETETPVAGKKNLARLYRAQTMIILQQAASALPVLDALAAISDPRVALRAQAVEGDVLCRVLDDRRHGIPVMQDALDHSTGTNWPGKSQLVANLGLYNILEGRDVEGLRRLHSAQASFEAEAQWDDLAESLKNEAATLKASGKSKEADAVQKHADEICAKAGLPLGPLLDPQGYKNGLNPSSN